MHAHPNGHGHGDDSGHEHTHSDGEIFGDTAEDWDARYSEVERRWSGEPNASLVREAARLEPGTALDVGCGEGADAVWLAQHGWAVTGLDISAVALERARLHAGVVGVEIELLSGDIADAGLAGRMFDLVSVHYPAFRRDERERALHCILDVVAPGGALLFVGHCFDDHEPHHPAFDPSEYLQPGDIVDALDQGWSVEVNETCPRVPPPGFDGPDMDDIVILARRAG